MTSKTFVIAGSGQFQEESHEAELYRQAARRMADRGFRVVALLPTGGRAAEEVADSDELAVRARALADVLAASAGGDLVVLAASLGCTLVLDAIAEAGQSRGVTWKKISLVLIGFVADDPVELPSSVSSVVLLTGEYDFVQYLDEDGKLSPVWTAIQHVSTTLDHLRPRTGVDIRADILPGAGHLLEPLGGSPDRSFETLISVLGRTA